MQNEQRRWFKIALPRNDTPVDSNHPLQILAFYSIKIKPKFIEKQSLPPAAQWHKRKSSSCVHVFDLNPFMNGLVWMFAFSVVFHLFSPVVVFF